MANMSIPKDDSPLTWLRKPFVRFLDYIEEEIQLLRLSMAGISTFKTRPDIIRFLQRDSPNDADSGTQLERAEEGAEIAQREIERGFPRLQAHAAVSIWSALEVLVEDLFITWLTHDLALIQTEAFKGVKVDIATYEGLDQDDRLRYVYERLRDDLGARRALGVGQFEKVLSVIGLGGGCHESVRKDLLELQQIRHIVVHRASIVDERLLERCPWLTFTVGEALQITHNRLMQLHRSTHEYMVELLSRACVVLGVEPMRPPTGFQTSD